MTIKAVEVSTKDLLELEELIEKDASIEEIREALKKARLYYSSEESLKDPCLAVFKKILWKYIVERE